MCREILQFIAYKYFFFCENLTHTKAKKAGFGWVMMRSLDSGFGRREDFRIAGKWRRTGEKWGASRRLSD
uniref:Uncharacterized protein n=1 Tax=Candidatus Methanogaster sp. ANME-2c ERB4 TaxID=2759911 RepID=A0A7G9YGT3_9EURY|nr:hypothetical protein ADAEDOLL_00023 [Methanosarcinales archaeon ANME-2c ERB4]QNO47313.1 hypothetical protein JBNABBKG_00006 [Methanosarcinales archaeon ANME-2c ERB4]